MKDKLERFREFLRGRGLKLTHQRETILDRTFDIDRHFSAEELYEVLRRESKGISKATVYRTLALLVEAELLEPLDFDRGHLLYERAVKEAHHDHLICVRCRRVYEFQSDEIERLQRSIAERYDFEMASHTHQIYGLCGRCRRREGHGADERRRHPRHPRIPRET